MYNDIEEMEKEIQVFRSKIKDSAQLCELLLEISGQLDTQKNDFERRYNGFLAELENIHHSIEVQSAKVITEHIEFNRKQQNDFEEKSASFLSVISAANKSLDKQTENTAQTILKIITEQKNDFEVRYSRFHAVLEESSRKIETQSAKVIAEYIDVNQKQQSAFKMKSDDILSRFDNLDIEDLRKEIKKINTKTNLLLSGIGGTVFLCIVVLLLNIRII